MITEDLPDLHLEISSKCALACPACPRTHQTGQFKIGDLAVSAIENIINSQQRFKMVTLCGGYGDPIYHSQFHDVITMLQQLPGAPRISVATNGSYRSREWWESTAGLMRKNDDFIFAIDGLKDTSSLYRRKNDWDSIMTAIEILKSHGKCKVYWQWILFRFNEHQIEEAARHAKKIGIDRFMIINSCRHEEVDSWIPSITIESAQARFRSAYDLSTL